jgi:phosphate transport system substrate-binding protein
LYAIYPRLNGKEKEMKKNYVVALLAIFVWGFSASGFCEEIDWVGTENGQPVFEAVGEAFSEKHTGVSVKIPPSVDSGGGIKAVANGEAVIARVARELNERESAFGLSWVPFASVQIVFYVHKDVGIQNLSVDQICQIYSGQITNWQAVGGKDLPIRVVTREEGDSALDTVEESLPCFDEIDITPRSKTVFDEATSVETVRDKPGAIGFGSFGFAANRGVTVLALDGKNPLDEAYPCALTLAMVFKEENKTGVIGDLVEFATSSDAHPAIREAGASPL